MNRAAEKRLADFSSTKKQISCFSFENAYKRIFEEEDVENKNVITSLELSLILLRFDPLWRGDEFLLHLAWFFYNLFRRQAIRKSTIAKAICVTSLNRKRLEDA